MKQEDDDGDDDNKKRSYNNDLDIFGQPKDGKKRSFEEEADIRGPDRIKSCIPVSVLLCFCYYVFVPF